ncbi:hypothetical protein cym2001_26240 [Pseudomonas sp. CYM-20-01]|uniref:hypothetical protein n=1 Tax=Pseudomonas sp. CYM-20-01 TaxID=2870750 RepID=UPI00204B0AB8|nr:hypothetical protein [Pseudomonas sp. CYM-20-01]BDB19259.1 hypothetical protein cym2001_26240 [Pseudomonas sp. CYM-20-01]
MSETVNIGEIAEALVQDIFSYFKWEIKPRWNENFSCHCPHHLTPTKKPKDKHPGDVIFFYEDPYLGSTIYLHSDLKAYKEESITKTKVRDAFKALAMSIECAQDSESWRSTFSIDTSEEHEVRGLLVVHNHDHGYHKVFSDLIDNIGFDSIPIPANVCLHFFGPEDLMRLYSIANDIMRLMHQRKISPDYTFYYPDLVMRHRQGDVWGQPATVEALTSPYLILQHSNLQAGNNSQAGYVVYYNRPGASPEEFEYLLDSLSRYQMLESGKEVQIRVTHKSPHHDVTANFNLAKTKYAKMWGFDPIREQVLNDIKISSITSMVDGYNIAWMGWRE